jgi:hypothetical protein
MSSDLRRVRVAGKGMMEFAGDGIAGRGGSWRFL